MNTRNFTKEELEAVYPEFPHAGIRKYEVYDITRWGTLWEVIFEFDGKYWRGYMEESGGDAEYNHWDSSDELQCTEVKAMQVLVTQWFPVE